MVWLLCESRQWNRWRNKKVWASRKVRFNFIKFRNGKNLKPFSLSKNGIKANVFNENVNNNQLEEIIPKEGYNPFEQNNVINIPNNPGNNELNNGNPGNPMENNKSNNNILNDLIESQPNRIIFDEYNNVKK